MTGGAPVLPNGYRLRCYERLDSTNEEAKRLARDGEAAPLVLWTREQSAGRGRRGRRWESPPGNLYFSLLLRPKAAPARAAQLAFVAAIAVGEALSRLLPSAIGVSFKWPNDVLLHGRKVAGILIESEARGGDRLAFLVIGVGVNLVSFPKDAEFPATSLAAIGAAASPAGILEPFLGAFAYWNERWRAEGFGPVRREWLARARYIGDQVRVRLDGLDFAGRFLDIDEEGALLLETAGEIRRIAAGAVFPSPG